MILFNKHLYTFNFIILSNKFYLFTPTEHAEKGAFFWGENYKKKG